MILDSLLQLSSAQAFSADAATTNTIDLGNVTPKRDIGDGEPLTMMINVTTAADNTTGDETYQFQFIQSANADLSSPDILVARTITAANLSAGSLHFIPIPAGAITKRYIGGYFDGGGTTPTVTASIFILPRTFADNRKLYGYADGVTFAG